MADRLVAKVFGSGGDQRGEMPLDPEIFGVEPNVAVMHQVVTAQLAAARAGSASTKTRSDVSGGGRKPWRQKGLGRARQGSTRSPQWRGGGVAFGPTPRSYVQRTPKKMKRLALRSALSARAAEAQVKVVERFEWEVPRTKDAVALLGAMETAGKVLVVLGRSDRVALRSLRNLPQVMVTTPDQLTAYDVLWADAVVFTSDSIGALAGRGGYDPSTGDFVREDTEGGAS